MKILFASAEVAPFAKVGGLADVAGSLPKALAARGYEVKVLLPRYGMIDADPRWRLTNLVSNLRVRMNPLWEETASYAETVLGGVTFGFIGTDRWYPPAIDSASLYQPGGDQHLFFSEAVLSVSRQTGWIPDIIHSNDWHTGFIPVLMREKYPADWSRTAAIFTIHNLAYQGEFGPEVLDHLGLPGSLFTPDRCEAWGRVNFLKSGAVYADITSTVSPTYAREIQTPAYGCALDGLMRHLADHRRLEGILNGIDQATFNPEADPAIPAAFSRDDMRGKAICRAELLNELGLPVIEGAPLMGVVSRVSSQKGMDLMLAAIDAFPDVPVQFVVQGLGEPDLAAGFRAAAKRHPKHIAFVERFDADLAQRIYAGCDLFLMPSSFEPCGLGQMIAMRYGTLPIVRATGGLADTVAERQDGFVFSDRNPGAMLGAILRAVHVYRQPAELARMRACALGRDFGWKQSAAEYELMYTDAVARRTRFNPPVPVGAFAGSAT